MAELFGFLTYLIWLYEWIIILSIVLSWLVQMDMMNRNNPTVRGIRQGLAAVTEPLLRPIRRVMPDTGAIDFAPLILLVACFGIRGYLFPFLQRKLEILLS